jgi:hypothetical protein
MAVIVLVFFSMLRFELVVKISGKMQADFLQEYFPPDYPVAGVVVFGKGL